MAVKGADVVATARSQLGKPYVWAAEGPDAYDCSGLMQWSYNKHGIRLPRVTYDQVNVGSPVASLAQAQPGDLIFTNRTGHVAMYQGGRKIVQASRGRVNEMTVGSGYESTITAIRRPPGVEGGPATGGGGSAAGAIGSAGIVGFASTLDLPGAANKMADALTSIAGSASSLTKVGDAALKLALPTTLMRAALLGGGALFVLLGLYLISREARQ